jgi:hypothetical protein
MKIEFQTVGNGTNVEVLLIDDFGVYDRAYSADHQARFHYPEDRGIPINARQLFQHVEETWAPPFIGGRYGRFHPYWAEREEKRKARQ